MSHTYDELKKKTVVELREIAAGMGENEAVKGYSQLNKEHLLVALCQALNIDTHAHRQVVGLDKTAIKAKIRVMKQKRDEVIEAGDHARLKHLRRSIHRMKRAIHKSYRLVK